MNRFFRITTVGMIVCGSIFGSGCSSFRSDINGAYGNKSEKQSGKDAVEVLFLFTHERQTVGVDVIPKLEKRSLPVSGFDEIFSDALKEFTNIKRYATFTDAADDVNKPERRALRDSLTSSHDYVIQLTFKKETSFAKNFLGTTVSSISATVLPVPYIRNYFLHAEVKDGNGKFIREYDRSASVTTWIQTCLILLYPFHPEQRKTEEIYVEFMHDLFSQIEAENVLSGTR